MVSGVPSLLRVSIFTSNESWQKFVVFAGTTMAAAGVNTTWFGSVSPVLVGVVKADARRRQVPLIGNHPAVVRAVDAQVRVVAIEIEAHAADRQGRSALDPARAQRENDVDVVPHGAEVRRQWVVQLARAIARIGQRCRQHGPRQPDAEDQAQQADPFDESSEATTHTVPPFRMSGDPPVTSALVQALQCPENDLIHIRSWACRIQENLDESRVFSVTRNISPKD